KSVSRRACAFFSPRLDPVLDRGKRDKDAVVAPEVPARWPVGHAVFDHQPHGEVHHAVGVLTAGWCQIGEVRAKVLATLRTVVLRIGDDEITRTPHVEIPQIMERPMRLLVPIGRVPTTRARSPDVVATVGDDLGLWQVCGCGDPGAWVGSVLTWTEHRVALLAQRFRPELYDKRLLGATRCSRYSLSLCHFMVEVTLFLMVHVTWPKRGVTPPPASAQPEPLPPKRTRAHEPTPFERVFPAHYGERRTISEGY